MLSTAEIEAIASSRPLRTLLIDNYDSFTYNLFQLLAEVNRCEPIVVFNDEPIEKVRDADISQHPTSLQLHFPHAYRSLPITVCSLFAGPCIAGAR